MNYAMPGRLHLIVNRRQVYFTFWTRRRYHIHYVFGIGWKNSFFHEPWPDIKAPKKQKSSKAKGGES